MSFHATSSVPQVLRSLSISAFQNKYTDPKNNNDQINIYNRLVIALFSFSGLPILVINWIAEMRIQIKTSTIPAYLRTFHKAHQSVAFGAKSVSMFSFKPLSDETQFIL
jgi:hypothetical protein